jgi:hypothetical protein
MVTADIDHTYLGLFDLSGSPTTTNEATTNNHNTISIGQKNQGSI